MRATKLILALVILMLSSEAFAQITVKGKISSAENYSLSLVQGSGTVTKTKVLNTKGGFKFKNLKKRALKNASLQLVKPDGTYFGPVVLRSKDSKAFLNFSGKSDEDTATVELGTIELKVGHAKAKKNAKRSFVNRSQFAAADADGKPVGAGLNGLASASLVSSLDVDPELDEAGQDMDGDGILNSFDFDDDGDAILDAADPDSAEGSASENPFTTLYLGMTNTINANIAVPTDEEIDAVIGGENLFNLIFFFPLAPDNVTTNGAHVICPAGLSYCSTTDDEGTAIYSGVSESNPANLGGLWTDLDLNGSGYPNLEPISLGGGYALVAGVQPRVGTSAIREGDTYRVEFTSEGAVVDSRILSLTPYFTTVPAIKSYDAGAGEIVVDYTSPETIVGRNSGNPIVVGGAGELRLTIYKPQIKTPGTTDSYSDLGHLHYGVILSSNAGEFTCGGFYSSLLPADTLTEDSAPLGEGDSPSSSAGANLWPLDDAADDAEASPANTITFTVDLDDCATRAGLAAGTYALTLTAAGEQLSGGANRAAQLFYVSF